MTFLLTFLTLLLGRPDTSMASSDASTTQCSIIPVTTTATIAFVDAAQVTSIIFASIISADELQTTYRLLCAQSNGAPQLSSASTLQTQSPAIQTQDSCSLAPFGETIVQSAETYFTGYDYWDTAERTWVCTISQSAICVQTVTASGQPSPQTLSWTETSAALLMKEIIIVDGLEMLMKNATSFIPSPIQTEARITAKPTTTTHSSSYVANATSVPLPTDWPGLSATTTVELPGWLFLTSSTSLLVAVVVDILFLA
jgi:hypothetical protein